jgi:predicted GNAT family acetyltransferase
MFVKLHRFSDVRQFYPLVEEFLVQHEAENCLLIGTLSVRLREQTDSGDLYLAFVEADGVVVGAAMRTPPYGMVLSQSESDEAVDLIAGDVFAHYGDTIPTVNAVKHVAHRFAGRYSALTGLTAEIDVAERIYRLDRLNPVRIVPGRLIPAAEEHRPLLHEWFRGFLADAFGTDSVDDAEIERQVEFRLSGNPAFRGLTLWVDAEKPVTMAGYTGPTPNGIRVGPIYTPQAYRRRGYATAATAALSQMLLEQGRRCCFLFTDLANPTSNHIYQEIGYRPVVDVDQLEFVRQAQ